LPCQALPRHALPRRATISKRFGRYLERLIISHGNFMTITMAIAIHVEINESDIDNPLTLTNPVGRIVLKGRSDDAFPLAILP